SGLSSLSPFRGRSGFSGSRLHRAPPRLCYWYTRNALPKSSENFAAIETFLSPLSPSSPHAPAHCRPSRVDAAQLVGFQAVAAATSGGEVHPPAAAPVGRRVGAADNLTPVPRRANDRLMSEPVRGVCVHLLALDLGFQIDLAAAQQLLADSERPRVVRARRPAPAWFEYEPAPLRVSIECEPLEVAGRRCEPTISCV